MRVSTNSNLITSRLTLLNEKRNDTNLNDCIRNGGATLPKRNDKQNQSACGDDRSGEIETGIVRAQGIFHSS